MTKACSLRRALRYQNRDVVVKFARHFQVAEAESAAVFEECKKWLWLNALPDAPLLFMSEATLIIDEMWHTFVLYTREYTEYCGSRFGRYVHHTPDTLRQQASRERALARDREGYLRRVRRQRAQQYRFIVDKLGSDTLRLWYVEYPLRYDAAFFARFGVEVSAADADVERALSALARERAARAAA
jgi:hypothetical protein